MGFPLFVANRKLNFSSFCSAAGCSRFRRTAIASIVAGSTMGMFLSELFDFVRCLTYHPFPGFSVLSFTVQNLAALFMLMVRLFWSGAMVISSLHIPKSSDIRNPVTARIHSAAVKFSRVSFSFSCFTASSNFNKSQNSYAFFGSSL